MVWRNAMVLHGVQALNGKHFRQLDMIMPHRGKCQ